MNYTSHVKRTTLLVATLTIVAGTSVPSAFGQADADPTEVSKPAKLRVGISPFPPFVIPGEPATGFSIELWKDVAIRLERPFEFVNCEGAADKINKLKTGELDVAIGGITTTAEREREIDFTHPTFRSGLGIMLPGPADSPSFLSRLQGALAKANTTVALGFFVVILLAGHLIWLIERSTGGFSKAYLPGVFEGIYWAVVTASTVGYGDKAPAKPAGRILAMAVIVISLPMFALFTAELTSAFTLQSISASIRGPEDLAGRRVGVIRGTSSAKFAASRGLKIRQSDQADEMYDELSEGKIAAVIYDAPSLTYYAQTEGADQVHMVDRTFEVRDLALATPQGSPLREDINRALLEMETTGALDELKVKWFGSQ